MLTNNNFSIRRHNTQQQKYHPWQQPPQWPMPILQQQQGHSYLRVHPEYLIRTVIASKIMQEQRAAATSACSPTSKQVAPHPSPSTDGMSSPFAFGMKRIRPTDLIKTVTESKIAQKRASAKFEAEKKRVDQLKEARTQRKLLQPPDFSSLNNDSILILEDFMVSLPLTYGKKFCYGELIKPVPLIDNGRYSNDQILIVGAQIAMAELRAHTHQRVAMALERGEGGDYGWKAQSAKNNDGDNNN